VLKFDEMEELRFTMQHISRGSEARYASRSVDAVQVTLWANF
jgi:hypothetical protein